MLTTSLNIGIDYFLPNPSGTYFSLRLEINFCHLVTLPIASSRTMSQFPSLRDYSERELLALPADSRLLFAENIYNGLLIHDPSPTCPYSRRKRRVLQPPGMISQNFVNSALSRIRALRCISHDISSFSLYPTTEHEYKVSKFLWNAANNFTFQAQEASALFQRNVFIISMPAALFEFLTSVTWEQLEDALVYILVCLAEGHEGMKVLKDELEAHLVCKIDRFATVDDPTSLISPRAFRLFVDIVMDRIPWMGPWVIPTTLCYLSAGDMTQLLSSRLDHEIFTSPDCQPTESMMWNIYRDWQTYHRIFVQNGGWSRKRAIELMTQIISKGLQSEADMTARAVLYLNANGDESVFGLEQPLYSRKKLRTNCHLAKRKSESNCRKSLLACLPLDVVLSRVIPKIFESIAEKKLDRRRPDKTSDTIRNNAETASRVTFSLKNWILENCKLESYYRRCEPKNENDQNDENRNDDTVDDEVHYNIIDVDTDVDVEADEIMYNGDAEGMFDDVEEMNNDGSAEDEDLILDMEEDGDDTVSEEALDVNVESHVDTEPTLTEYSVNSASETTNVARPQNMWPTVHVRPNWSASDTVSSEHCDVSVYRR